MGKIIYKGKSYSGSSAPSSNEAKDIIYDNAESGLSATDVQDAVNELSLNTGYLLKRKHLAQYLGGTDGNTVVDITVPDGCTLIQYPMIQATMNTVVDGVYLMGAAKVSDTVIRLYFNKAFTNAVVIALDYSVN